MTDYHNYSAFHQFIETFSPTGFNGIDSNHPLLLDLELMMERDNQFITIVDIIQMKYLFTSKRSVQMIGFEPEIVTPYHFMEVIHPEDIERLSIGRTKLIKMAQDIFIANKGEAILSTNFRIRNYEGIYANVLFQCYLFYSETPYKTVYLLKVHTNIDWYKKLKKGIYYYSGTDFSHFRFPDNQLFNSSNDFTKREFEIIKLVGQGMSTEQIAVKLFLSPYTINTHRGNILKKSGKRHISELIYELMEQGKL